MRSGHHGAPSTLTRPQAETTRLVVDQCPHLSAQFSPLPLAPLLRETLYEAPRKRSGRRGQAMGFNLRHFLRQIPPRTLEPFLASVELPFCGGEVWDTDEAELAHTLYARVWPFRLSSTVSQSSGRERQFPLS